VRSEPPLHPVHQPRTRVPLVYALYTAWSQPVPQQRPPWRVAEHRPGNDPPLPRSRALRRGCSRSMELIFSWKAAAATSRSRWGIAPSATARSIVSLTGLGPLPFACHFW